MKSFVSQKHYKPIDHRNHRHQCNLHSPGCSTVHGWSSGLDSNRWKNTIMFQKPVLATLSWSTRLFTKKCMLAHLSLKFFSQVWLGVLNEVEACATQIHFCRRSWWLQDWLKFATCLPPWGGCLRRTWQQGSVSRLSTWHRGCWLDCKDIRQTPGIHSRPPKVDERFSTNSPSRRALVTFTGGFCMT